MKRGKTHVLRVWGDYGCFSRPELKTERFSYPCPTPSAARGIFDSIYCKAYNRKTKVSCFYWQIERIELLTPPSYIALRRNEVSDTVSADRTIHQWMKNPDKFSPVIADESRQQRQTMALRDPQYRIHGHIVTRAGFENKIKSFDQQFERRARKGKFFTMPNLGCREFPAFFEYIDDFEKKGARSMFDQDIGFMLYDVFDLSKASSEFAKPSISVFRAEIKDGQLHIPEFNSKDVLKVEGGNAT